MYLWNMDFVNAGVVILLQKTEDLFLDITAKWAEEKNIQSLLVFFVKKKKKLILVIKIKNTARLNAGIITGKHLSEIKIQNLKALIALVVFVAMSFLQNQTGLQRLKFIALWSAEEKV